MNKKGLAMAWGGVLVICLVATLVVYYMVGAEPVTKEVFVKQSKLIVFGSDVQLYRKMIPESTEPIVQYSTYKLGKAGGGYNIWRETVPTKENTIEKLLQQIEYDLPGAFNDGSKRITFPETTIDLTEQETSFILEGSRQIKINDNDLTATSTSQLTIDKEIPSLYFKLIDAGLAIFEEESYYQYIINSYYSLEDKAIMLQRELENNFDFDFGVSVSGDKLKIIIVDPESMIYLSDGTTDSLELIFEIEVSPESIVTGKTNPVELEPGWNYIYTPYAVDITVADAKNNLMECYLMDIEAGIGSVYHMDEYVLEWDELYNFKVSYDCIWYCNSNIGACA